MIGWAILAAVIGAAADAAIFSESGRPLGWRTLLGALGYMLLAVPWRYLGRNTRDYAMAAGAWSAASAIFCVALALALGSRQSAGQWAGFGLIVIGVIVRALCGR